MIAKETAQEVTQEGFQIGAETYAKKKEGIKPDTAKQNINRLKDTAVDSALAFGFMGVPGTVYGGLNINKQPTQKQFKTQAYESPIQPETNQTPVQKQPEMQVQAVQQQPEVQVQPVQKPSQIASPPVQNTEYAYDEKSYEDLYNYINSKQEPIIPKKTTPEERIQAFQKDVKDKKEWPVSVRISKEKFNQALLS